MKGYWEAYESILCPSGDRSLRSSKSTRAAEAFERDIINDPGYTPAVVEGADVSLAISRKSANSCSIKASPNTNLKIGDVVECIGESWLAANVYADKIGLVNGELWLCNGEIKFQNRSPKIISRKCVIDDGTYSKKSSDPDVFVPTNTYRVYVPIDDETNKLFIDKRIPFGIIHTPSGELALEVYKIVGIDKLSKNFGDGSHLMMITMQRDVYDPTSDSIENGICDVYVPTSDTFENKELGNWSIEGRDTIRIGTTRTYRAFLDGSASVPSGIEPLWSLTCDPSVVAEDGGMTCSISIPLDETLVGSTVIIRLTDENQSFGFFEKKVQVISVG